MPIPDIFRGGVRVLGTYYPSYRLFVLLAGCLIFLALWLLMHRTRIGALIRAGVDDAEMVEASGINIKQIFLLTSALAGLGGLLEARISRSILRPMPRFSYSASPSSSSAVAAASSASRRGACWSACSTPLAK